MRRGFVSLCALLAVLAGCATGVAFEPMTQARLEGFVRDAASASQGEGGVVEFQVEGVHLACVSDPSNDRMRIVSPIARIDDLEPEHFANAMVANFHSALDARYAISGDILYSAFIHPLSSLHDDELASALRQVVGLVQTFGTTYSSGELVFRGGSGGAEEAPAPESY